MSDAGLNRERCRARRSDGTPCTAPAVSGGFCIGHRPGVDEARRRGGAATSSAARAIRLLPARLRPVADQLTEALAEVHGGTLEPRCASAMAALASALVRVMQAGEL